MMNSRSHFNLHLCSGPINKMPRKSFFPVWEAYHVVRSGCAGPTRLDRAVSSHFTHESYVARGRPGSASSTNWDQLMQTRAQIAVGALQPCVQWSILQHVSSVSAHFILYTPLESRPLLSLTYHEQNNVAADCWNHGAG